jgi:hypothetical protein
MGRIRIRTCLTLLACVACGFVAAPAQASFHLMSVREVFPGSSSAGANAEYVVLQMYAPGQNLVMGHEIETFLAGGGFGTGPNFVANVPNGENQRTILVATAAAQSAFGISADQTMNAGTIDPTGGAVCYDSTIDCLSWGSFSGSLGSPTGTPAAAIPDGMALRRSIAPGCSPLLESGDDTNNSAADFQIVSPNPRNNASSITETACGAGADTDAPQTKIKKRPANHSTDTSPTFKFKSDEPDSKFKCKLDRKKFKKCKSPKTFHGLDPGKHTFKVEATDAFGNLDKSPAKDKFKVLP